MIGLSLSFWSPLFEMFWDVKLVWKFTELKMVPYIMIFYHRMFAFIWISVTWFHKRTLIRWKLEKRILIKLLSLWEWNVMLISRRFGKSRYILLRNNKHSSKFYISFCALVCTNTELRLHRFPAFISIGLHPFSIWSK